MKKLFALLLAAMLLTLPVLAEYDTFDYTGPLDSFSGLPKDYSDEETDGHSGGNSLVSIATDVYYDNQSDVYKYYGEDAEGIIECSVMDGMITSDPVETYLPTEVEAELYMDGNLVEGDISLLYTPGSYTLSRVNGENRIRVLSFTIVNAKASALLSYRMPSSFCVDDVRLNNEELYFEPESVDFYDEGDYKIYYHCMKTNKAYTLFLNIDHTAPVLALEAVTDGVAAGPVDISDREITSSVRITLDGVEIQTTDLLKQSGQYHISIFDEAGNSSEYFFRIRVYFNVNSVVFILLVAAVAVTLISYMKITRRKMRVR